MHDAEVIVHVRYDPKGDVIKIAEQPDGTTPQGWYNYLCTVIPASGFHPLSGGRAAIYMTHEQLATAKDLTGERLEIYKSVEWK
jgi:hypothetical protein